MALNLTPPPPVKVPVKDLSFKEKLTSRWRWLRHITEAFDQYNNQHGGFYAGGLTYSAMLAIFPLLLVSLSASGFILSGHQELLHTVEDRIGEWLSNATRSKEVIDILNRVIQVSSTVGIFGVLGMLWTGINFISGLREALTHQWGSYKVQRNFFVAKFNDFIILVSLYSLMAVVLALFVFATIVRNNYWGNISQYLGIHPSLTYFHALNVLGFLARYLIIFGMWTYVIAKLPRIQIPLKNAVKPGLLMTVLFSFMVHIFGFLLVSLERNPILGVFISVFAIMLFIYWTIRILLFCTAWAATAPENQIYNYAPRSTATVVVAPVIEEKSLVEDFPLLPTAVASSLIAAAGVLLGSRWTNRRAKRYK